MATYDVAVVSISREYALAAVAFGLLLDKKAEGILGNA